MGKRKTWTVEEKQLLKDIYHKLNIYEIMKYYPNKSKESVMIMARRMGLKKDNEIKLLSKKKNLSKVPSCWTEEKDKALIEYHNKGYSFEQICNIFKHNSKPYIKQKMKQLELMSLSKYDKIKPQIKDDSANSILKLYKLILENKIDNFRPLKPTQEQIILCFKYYLKINNINYNKTEWCNIIIGKLLEECKLKSQVKKKFNGYYDFISKCFPKYSFKEYEFKNLNVSDDFWKKDYNRYDCIKNGISKMQEDKIIKDIDEVFTLDINIYYKYFHRTLIYYYGVRVIEDYFEYNKIDINNDVVYNNCKFDSKEEKSVYIYIKRYLKNNFPSYNISKCKTTKKFYNKKYNEWYIPDFIINDKIVIEYYGLYNKQFRNKFQKEYYLKTLRKNEYYNGLEGYDFIALYPEDLLSDFKGVREKLTSFLYTKYNKGEIAK